MEKRPPANVGDLEGQRERARVVRLGGLVAGFPLRPTSRHVLLLLDHAAPH